ncbi:MAG: tetraacyldisaccharide 4'-kinase [Flavobacteriaceae bacterium]|nr:tetraacyldisaccharide 4'-kinase [Flavobacteriaceae bacterium]
MQLLRKVLLPVSWVYGLVVWFRNKVYDWGLLSSTAFDVPIICIGNLSVGGTGKTPMTEYLLQMLLRKHKVAVLSRGYKRKSKGYVLANPQDKVEKLGDEPYQMYKKYPQMHLALDANRSRGIQNLLKQVQPQIILLDDAMQHRKVKAGYYVMLTAYDDLYIEDRYLPTGNLRDHKNQAARADIIVVTKCPVLLKKDEKAALILRLRARPEQEVLFASLRYDSNVEFQSKKIPLKQFVQQKFVLLTGIANAQPLVAYLKEQGGQFEHLEYSDHHHFSEKEIEQFRAYDRILTTQKDLVRLEGKLSNLYSLAVKHDLGEDTAGFTKAINAFLKSNK